MLIKVESPEKLLCVVEPESGQMVEITPKLSYKTDANGVTYHVDKTPNGYYVILGPASEVPGLVDFKYDGAVFPFTALSPEALEAVKIVEKMVEETPSEKTI